MHFRGRHSLLGMAVACLILGASGCGKFHFFASAPNDAPLKLDPSEVGCLSRSSATFKDFVEGKATDDRINDLWHCTARSLELFDEHVKGTNPGEFNPDELRKFLQRYFVTDFKISDLLVKDAMELKKALLGGSTEIITSAELARARFLFNLFNNHMLRLRPFLPLSKLRSAGVDDSTVDYAAREMELAGIEIGNAIQETATPYVFDHLDRLFNQIGVDSGKISYRTLRDRAKMVRAAKAILVEPPSTSINPLEWGPFFKTAGQAFSIYIRFHHFEKNYPKTWTCGRGRERMLRVLTEAQELVKSAIQRHPGAVVPFSEMDELLDTLDWTVTEDTLDGTVIHDHSKYTGQKFMETIKETLRPLVRKAMGGLAAGPNGRDANGLTVPALARVWDMFLEWNEEQHYLEASYRKLGRFDCDETAKNPFGITKVHYPMDKVMGLSVSDGTSGMLPSSVAAVEAFRKDLRTSRLLSADESEEIFFPIHGGPNGDEDQHTFYNISQMNLLRLATHMSIAGWTDPAEINQRAAASVSIDEFDQFYKDLRNLGIESEYFDYRKWDTARRRFREANLFLFHSNGDMYLDQTEGFEFIVFLGSAKKLSSRYLDEIAKQCPGTDLTGLYNTVSVPADCFKERFFAGFPRFLVHMPGMAAYYQSLSAKKLTKFQDNIMSIATDGLSPGERVDDIGSEKLSTLFHYTEAALRRFDTDYSQTLNANESIRAYQVFRPTFAVLVREKSDYFQTDEDFEALFTYLLANGSMPTATYVGGTDYEIWKARRGTWFDWSINADRGRIFEIFADLSKKQ